MQKPHRYDYLIDPHDKNHVGPMITRMIGPGKRVLELGAGPGSLTRFMREQAGCTITAVELDEHALPSLVPYCEAVFQRDLNDPDWSNGLALPSGYDVVVAADVLEHLYEPWKTLVAAKALLASDGHVVLSLPHAGHNAVLAALLCGDFRYHDWGLLDFSHIRFFGLKNIEELFAGAGYVIVDHDYVIRPPEATELGIYWKQLPRRTRKVLARSPHGNIYQVVVKARPGRAGEPESSNRLQLWQETKPLSARIVGGVKQLLPVSVKRALRRALSANNMEIL